MARSNKITWYNQLKFRTNPLDVRPNVKLVGLHKEEERLINHIRKEEICFLNGLTGSGKTSLLRRIRMVMKNHAFIYLDAHDLPKDFNLEKELRKRRNFFDKLTLRTYPRKKPVLIIDEFQATDPRLVLEARGKWENTEKKKIKSIVIAQISRHLKNVSPSFKERIGNRTITLGTLDDDELVEMLNLRLNNNGKSNYLNQISKEALELLINLSGANPRRLLEYADLLFDFHFKKFRKKNPILKKDYKITFHGAKEILSLNDIKVGGFERKIKAKKRVVFEKMFTKPEQKILRILINSDTLILDDIGKKAKLSLNTVRNLISQLKNKNAVIGVGKQDRKILWQITPQIKRMTVRV